LIQCFFHSIAHDGIGEISVYLIDGEVTHAGYAKPAKGGYLIHEEHGGMGDDHNATEEEIAYAEMVYRAATTITGTKPLYFRVDMVYDNAGDLALMEIACATTDMNFRDEPDAAIAMAEAVDAFLKAKESLFEATYGRPSQLIDDETYDQLYGLDENEEEFEYELFGRPMRVKPQNKTTAKCGSEAQLNKELKEE